MSFAIWACKNEAGSRLIFEIFKEVWCTWGHLNTGMRLELQNFCYWEIDLYPFRLLILPSTVQQLILAQNEIKMKLPYTYR